MPIYTVEDDQGNTLKLEGDSPPTEQELEDIFSQRYPKSTSGTRDTAITSPLGFNWDSPEMTKTIDQLQRQEQMRRDVGAGMEAGTDLTGAVAQSMQDSGLLPSPQREQSIEERMTPGLSPEKAALERQRLEIQDEGVPMGLRLAAAAHSGLEKGMQLPSTILQSLYKIGRMTPGEHVAGKIRQALFEAAIAPEDRERTLNWFKDTFGDPEKANDEYFQNVANWEHNMSQRDAMLGDPNFATQLAEGTARGLAELPAQMLGGVGAATEAAAIKGASIGAGAVSGAQRFSQELGEGTPEGTALSRAGVAGLISGVTTKAFGLTGVQSIFRKEGVSGIANRIKDVLVQAGYQGAQGALDQIQQDLSDRIEKNPDKPIEDSVNDALLSGTVGSILGGAMASVHSTGGDHNASEVSKAAEVHGDVLSRERKTTKQMSAHEGGEGVQSQAQGRIPQTIEERIQALENDPYVTGQNEKGLKNGRKIQELQLLKQQYERLPASEKMTPEERAATQQYGEEERAGMSESTQMLHDSIESENAGHLVETGDLSTTDENGNKSYNRIAQWKNGKIVIDPVAWNAELDAIPANKRKQMAKTIMNEEVVHSATTDQDAWGFYENSSPIERAIGRRIYSGKWGSKEFSNGDIGAEMIRRRVQRINKMTPTEMLAAAGREKWTVHGLQIIEDAVSRARQQIGTKASKEQLAAIDRTLENLGRAKTAVSVNANGGRDELQPFSIARTAKVQEMLKKIDEGEAFPNNNEAIEAGLEAGSVHDLDAMLEARRDIQTKLKEARNNKDLNAMMGLVGPNQFLREAIETATSSGSHRVDLRKFGERGLPEPKLDWRKNADVKNWLRQNGPELGIELNEGPAALSRAAEKRIAKLREERLKEIAASERDEMSVDAMSGRIAELSNKQRESHLTENEQQELADLRRARFQRESDNFGPFAMRRGGMSKKEQRLAELRRKLMEARGEELPEELRTSGKPASGSEYAPVAPEDRVGASESGALPRMTAEDLSAKAEDILSGDINLKFRAKSAETLARDVERSNVAEEEGTGRAGPLGISTGRTTAERPNFKEFSDWAKRNFEGAQPHQIRSIWEDSVWGMLLKADPERLEQWRKALGLEKKYGKSVIYQPTSSEKQQEFNLRMQEGDKVLARQQRASNEAAQRYRGKVIQAIAQKLVGESMDDRPSLDRTDITTDDVDFGNANAKYSPYEEFTAEDIKNPDVVKAVLRDQARASSSDPESASRRLVAVVDKTTGKVELLSTYNDAGIQRVTDPAGARLTKKPSRELNANFLRQYRPIASLLLADPVRAFRKQFQTVGEFNDAIANDAKLRSTIGEHFQETPSEFKAEGTPGIEGEGGYLIGKHKAASGAEISRPGAMESKAGITNTEARELINHVWDEAGAFDSPQDVKDTLDGLTDRADRGKIDQKDRLAINAFRKIYQAYEEAGLGKGSEALTPDQKHEALVDRVANTIFEFNESSKTPSEFAEKIGRVFKGEGAADAGAVAEAPSKFSRELTMPIERRAPTDVQAENLPPGVEPIRGQPPERPVPRLRYQHEEPTIEEINADREKASHASKEYEMNQMWDELLTADERKLNNRRMLAQKLRQRIYRKTGVLISGDQAMDVAIHKTGTPEEIANLQTDKIEKSFFGPSAIRRTNKPTIGEIISNALHDTLSGYDSWMIDRIDDYGGPVAKKAAELFRHIVDREKELYGGLTPLLDRARKLAGGVEPSVNSVLNVKKWAAEQPARIKSSMDAMRAMNWMNGISEITPKAGVARTVRAIEGTIGIPRFAQNLVDAAQAANKEIGMLLQPVIKGFLATGKFQRNMTSLGYDIIRRGGGEMWNHWTEALAVANKLNLKDVQDHFRSIKEALDDPATNSEVLEKINQDMARQYKKVVTHLKGPLGWQPIVHSDLFNYLENAARRATHVRAFRETFPKTPAGQIAFKDMMKSVKSELPDESVDDLNDVIRAMHGHPTDNYNNRMLSYARMGPQQVGGQLSRMLNSTVNNVLGKMVLSGQMFVQPGETVSGSTQVFLGYNNYLKALARYRQLYPQLELTGAVNRVMHDYTYNPTSPVRSVFKIAGNAISKLSMQNALNELQEGLAAATARVVSENIHSGNLSSWEKSMLPQTFKMMGFNPGEVQKMMTGDVPLLNQFQRKAAAFLTGGNKSVAEGSSLGSNRLFNSIFRFQTYPMIKMNQTREMLTHWVDTMRTGTGTEKLNASRMAGRFLFGNAMQGALTVGLTSLAYGGLSGLKIRMNEAKDEPFKFLTEAFLSSISGPAYLLWQGKTQKGLGGYGEQAARMAFPYAVMNDLNDMAMGFGQYKDRPTFQRIGMFLKNKTPGTRAIGTGLAMVGLSQQNQKLDESMKALSRWRRENLGFSENRDYFNVDERKDFRMHIKQAIDAMKVGDQTKFNDEWMAAAGAQDIDKVGQSFKARRVLVGPGGKALDADQKEALRKHIGDDAYEALEYYDLMLDQAADGVLLPRN